MKFDDLKEGHDYHVTTTHTFGPAKFLRIERDPTTSEMLAIFDTGSKASKVGYGPINVYRRVPLSSFHNAIDMDKDNEVQ